MIKKIIIRFIIVLTLVLGLMYFVNSLEIGPESKEGKKILPNDIIIQVK
jgi:lipopolysaccharide export LptBFGC system permease protein LptF